MQAIILAAGRGTRMKALTDSVPKPMLMIGDKPALEHKLLMLPKNIDEVIFVVGYLENVIRAHFGLRFAGKRIRYQRQKVLNGTGGALHCVKDRVRDRFIVLMRLRGIFSSIRLLL